MPGVTQAEIQRARQVDLLSYLQQAAPEELVRLSRGTYCTREHDSLKISNGLWYWFSQNVGGASALDYLMKVKGYSREDAAEAVLSKAGFNPSYFIAQKKEPKPREFEMPKVAVTTYAVEQYLRARGIHPQVIAYCLQNKLLFQTEKYRNALFLGYDSTGTPRYGALRGTMGNFKGEVSGSDKRFAFKIATDHDAESARLFESAIDLLSFASFAEMRGLNWKGQAMLSLAGIYKNVRRDTIPAALQQFLKDYPKIKTIHLHLDNDEIGRGAAQGIASALRDQYKVLDEPPKAGKDVNELLQMAVKSRRREEPER